MINYGDAIDIINAELSKIEKRTEIVDLLDSLGRILAKDVFSDIDQPPFNNSAMDGIAVKFNSNIKSWAVLGEISAGNFEEYNIDENSCVRIMTGGKIPVNADTVIPIELISDDGDVITLLDDMSIKRNQHIREKASDLHIGMLAIKQDTQIKSNHIPMLATCGVGKVTVYSRLKIGLLVTGDELVEISEKPEGDKIRASNLYTLILAIKEAGHIPVSFGLVGDDRSLTEEKIITALNSDIDIFITTGGVSVGKYDFIKEILQQNDIDEKFWSVNIKPGKPVFFGTYKHNNKHKLVFGLPGNPVSSFVTFLVFVKYTLDKYYNINSNNIVRAELTSDLNKKDGKRHFSRGMLYKKDEQYFVVDSGSHSSGDMAGLSNANCLIVIKEERISPKKGEKIECIVI